MKIKSKKINLSLCIQHFKNIMNLFCAHIIEKRIIDAIYEKILLFIDVYAHWRFEKSKRYFVEFAIFFDIEVDVNETSTHNPLLNIQNSQKIRSKERPKFALNRSKTMTKQKRLKERQRAFDNLTQRTFFDFEYA